MGILEFLLIVILVGFAIFAFVVWRIWKRIHNTVNQFNRQFSGNAQQQATSQNRTTKTDSGETIIDTRSQEKLNRKIFNKDEGEYVDYEVKG